MSSAKTLKRSKQSKACHLSIFSCLAYSPYHEHINILVAVICISLQKLCSALTAHGAHVHKLKSSLLPLKCEFEVMQFSNQHCCDNCSIYLVNCIVGDQSLAIHLATAMIPQFVITHSLRITVVDSKRTCWFMLTEEKLTRLVLHWRHTDYLHSKCVFFAHSTEWIKTAAFISMWENYWLQILRHASWRKAEFCELVPSWNTCFRTYCFQFHQRNSSMQWAVYL
jgi:hypothetical protein